MSTVLLPSVIVFAILAFTVDHFFAQFFVLNKKDFLLWVVITSDHQCVVLHFALKSTYYPKHGNDNKAYPDITRTCRQTKQNITTKKMTTTTNKQKEKNIQLPRTTRRKKNQSQSFPMFIVVHWIPSNVENFRE